MNEVLFENTKISSYFLWEYTYAENALGLWTCAEDIANYLEVAGIFTPRQIKDIIDKGIYSYEYIGFVRHIAFRIFIYTGHDDAETNWFRAEKLLNNSEWCAAITQTAKIYFDNKSNFDSLPGVRSEQVKQNHL